MSGGGERHAGVLIRVRDPRKLEALLDLAEDIEAGLVAMMPKVVVPGATVVIVAEGTLRHAVFCNRRIARGGAQRCVLRPGHEPPCSALRPEEVRRELTRERFGDPPRQG